MQKDSKLLRQVNNWSKNWIISFIFSDRASIGTLEKIYVDIVLNFNDSHYNSSQLGSRVNTNNLMEIRVAHLLLWLEKGNQIHDLNEYGDSLLVWW